MKLHHRWAVAVLFVVASSVSTPSHAAAISGQGTWETTLQARDFDGNTATIEGYYDTVLNITWQADANVNGTSMNWFDANAWVASLDINGFTGWRLPTLSPINGSTFNTVFTNNATSDVGSARTTTDGTDGGWRDGNGTPVSEMGHMYYVTLGNVGDCTVDDSNPTSCAGQMGSVHLTNTGPFSNIQAGTGYWSDLEFDSTYAWKMSFGQGFQNYTNPGGKTNPNFFAWAVHDGDIGTAVVPIPAAALLFGSGLLGLIGMARRKK